MKTLRLQQFLAFLGILIVSLSCSLQAVTITVSPSSVDNLYQGYVTLIVDNGLTNGEQVLIERFVDYNTNGAVDANDMLVQTLRLTDGKTKIFGGVTNMNSPGDLTGTNGAITTVVSFYGNHPGKFMGNYVFRVSSPTGRFTPATATFSVTNAEFAQAISGAVLNNGTNVPYAGVFLMDGGPNQGFVSGMFADSAGNFRIKAGPGAYVLGAAKSGYVFDFSTGPQITLNSGVDVTTNANATAATRTISGNVRELGNAAKTLGGVEINGESQSGFVLAFSDTNGDFTIPVTAGVWKMKLQEEVVAWMGYLTPKDEPARPLVDATSGSVSGVNIDLPKVDALFYGSLKTSANAPLVGIGVEASGSSDGSSYPYSGVGNTDSNGNYFIGVVATNWNVGPDSDVMSALGYSANGTNTGINSGQAIQVDFTAQSLTVHLSGRVLNGSGNPISDIQLIVNDWNNGSFSARTDGDGYFNIGLIPGTWHLELESQGAAEQGLIGPSLAFSNLVDGANITNIVYVAQNVTAQITGNVHDTNSNPITFVGISANLTVNGTNYMASAQTDGGGNYSLGVFNGTWSLNIAGNDLSSRGFQVPSNQDAAVSGNVSVNFTVYPIDPLQITTANLSAGVVFQNYHTNLQATGGQQPYSWSIASGSLPPGVSFNSGLIDGIPTNSGTYNFNIQVSDQQANTTNKNFSITINPLLQITTVSLPNGTNGQAYSSSLTASGGVSPYIWQIGGALPTGLNLNTNTGALSGTPTGSGTTFFTVLVRDANGNTTNKNLSIAINSSSQPLQITTTNPPTGAVSENYHFDLQATGGQQPYFWSVISGSLPPGVNLNSTSIDGTPTNSGTFGFTIQVSDQLANTTNKSFSVTINPALQITTLSLPNGTNGQFYSATLAASGGIPPYGWSTSGPLPAGISLETNGALSGTPTNSGTVFFTVLLTDSKNGFVNRNLSITIDSPATAPTPATFINPTAQVEVSGRATVYLNTQSNTPPTLDSISTNNLDVAIDQSASVPNGSSSLTARAQGDLKSRSFYFDGTYGITGNLGSGSQPYVDVNAGANAQLSFTVDQDTPYTFTFDVSMNDATGDPQKTFSAVQGNIEMSESGSIILSTYLDRQSLHFSTNGVFVAGRPYHLGIGCGGYIHQSQTNYSGSANALFHGSLTIIPALQVSLLSSEISLRWPVGYMGYVPESAPAPSGPWTPDNTPPTLNGAFYELHSPTTGVVKFFRLRHP